MIMMKFKKLFYSNILVYALILAFICPGISYSYSNTLRVPIGNYTRLEETINTIIMNKKAFPSSLLRELFSETGLKISFYDKQGEEVSIDLSIPGINDGIVIKFVNRKKLNNQPFTKTESDNKIIYTIANDITLNEVRYVLKDMDSILSKYENRLKLSNTFSLRLRHLVIYLAKNIDLEQLGENSSNLRKRIEELYILGLTLDRENILNPDKKITPVTFEEIKNKRYLYKQTVLDYMKDKNILPNLTSKNISAFIKKILKIMKKEAIIAVRAHFSEAIFVKGIEGLFSKLRLAEKIIFYLNKLTEAPISELLKDSFLIEDWKNRLKNAETENEEVEIVKEIVTIVDRYPGWEDEKGIEYMIKYAISRGELDCLGRSMLLLRILKEIGIREDRLYVASFPGHVFLIMKLTNGDYLEIQTTKNAFYYTRILPAGIKTELDSAVKKAKLLGSAHVRPKESLWRDSEVFAIYNNLEGLIGASYLNLAYDFKKFNLTKKQKIKLYKMQIMLFKEAIDINPDYENAFNNWGNALEDLAMIEKDNDPEKAIKYLNEACAKYEKAAAINPNYAIVFYNWGNALYKLAMIEKDNDPEKAIKYLNEACAKYEKAAAIDSNYESAFNNWAVVLSDFAMVERDNDQGKAIGYLNEAIKKIEKAATINPNHAGILNSWAEVLYKLAMIEKNNDPEKAMGHLSEAIEKIEKALIIVPQDGQAKDFLEIFRKNKNILEQNMSNNAIKTAL